MTILKSELINYKNNTILKETTDKKNHKFIYSIINSKNSLFDNIQFFKLEDAKKYITMFESLKSGDIYENI